MTNRGQILALLTACGAASAALAQPVVITGTGATAQEAFFRSPASTNDFIDVDGDDLALFDPCGAIDFNGDGILDNGDIGAFIGLFLGGNLTADVNGDGILDNGDIGAFIALFLSCSG